MLLLVTRSVPIDYRVDAYLKISAVDSLKVAMRGHWRSLLMSAHQTANTTAALILLDQSCEMVFYLKEGDTVK